MTEGVESAFDVVSVASPDPRLRGSLLGEAARDRIRESKAAYEETFAYHTGLGWDEIKLAALEFAEPIADYDGAILEEIEGIAEGSGLELADLLAINARTEIMFGLKVPPVPECTAFYAGPGATADGHVLLGQNWDWRSRARDSIILAEVDQGPDRPAFAYMPEAGLIGKTGFNGSGIGVTLNALVSSIDRGQKGVPVHVILRGILNSRTLEEAVAAVVRAQRGASAAYMIGSASGVGVGVETGPGGVESVFVLHPEEDLLAHSNHFVAPTPFEDLGKREWPDTVARCGRMGSLLAERQGEISPEAMESIFTDDEGHPSAICRFPDPEIPSVARIATVASIVMDLTARSSEVAAGPPSEHEYSNFTPAFAKRASAVAAT